MAVDNAATSGANLRISSDLPSMAAVSMLGTAVLRSSGGARVIGGFEGSGYFSWGCGSGTIYADGSGFGAIAVPTLNRPFHWALITNGSVGVVYYRYLGDTVWNTPSGNAGTTAFTCTDIYLLNSAVDDFFDGWVQDVELYNVALTLDEVALRANGGELPYKPYNACPLYTTGDREDRTGQHRSWNLNGGVTSTWGTAHRLGRRQRTRVLGKAPSGSTAYTVPVSETWTTFSDAEVVKYNAKVTGVADTVALSEALAAHLGAHLAPADTVALSESLATHFVGLQGISDTVALSAALAASQGTHLALSDTVALSEAVAAHLGAHLSPADTVGLSESIAAKYNAKVAPADTVALSEAIAAKQGTHAALADTVSLSESLAAHLGAHIAAGDTVPYSEVLTNPSGSSYTVSISTSWGTYSESLAASQGTHLALSDSVALSDALAAHQNMKQPIADAVSLTDAIVAKYNAKTTAADTVGLSEAIASRLGAHLAPADTVAFSATTAAKYNAKVAPADTVLLFEVLTNPASTGVSSRFFLVQ